MMASVLQFSENLTDRQAAEAVRDRMTWKYALGPAYRRTVHSETGEAPAARWEKATREERAVPEPGLLREAFLWSERRKADKTALVRMHGNAYQVDAWQPPAGERERGRPWLTPRSGRWPWPAPWPGRSGP
jgi:hypothetical protein